MMRADRVLQLLQGALLIAAASAACGPPTEPATPDDGSTGGGAGEEQPAAGGAPSGEAPGPTPEPAAPAAESVPISATTMAAEIGKLGINMKKIPELQKLPLGQKKKVMPFFQKALGYEKCTGCHAKEDDFKTETRNMKMARNMWNHFVVNLRDDKGGNVFCDSCHNGKSHVLARGDKKAMEKFMKDQYEGKLARADGAEHSCSTCHGDDLELKIFEKMWKIPAK
jgi:hypothetical protein